MFNRNIASFLDENRLAEFLPCAAESKWERPPNERSGAIAGAVNWSALPLRRQTVRRRIAEEWRIA